MNQDLVANNIGLVRKVALRYAAVTAGVAEYDDLHQVGVLGLAAAIDKHDASKGKLSTIAVPYIEGYIKHYLRDNCQPGGLSGVPRAITRPTVVSLNKPLCGMNFVDQSEFIDLLPDDRSTAYYYDHLWLDWALKQISTESAQLLRLYYLQGLSQKSISKQVGKAHTTISRQVKQNVQQLKLIAKKTHENPDVA